MSIEVTSVVDQRGIFSLQKIAGAIIATLRRLRPRLQSKLIQLSAAVFAVLFVITTSFLIRSYKYYAQVVDARLARGYLTSRPGLYAAPSTLRPGQGLTPQELSLKLRRAGYVEAEGSDVWNGTFSRQDRSLEIRPSEGRGYPVRVFFDDNGITKLIQGETTLDSFTLEPEILTNEIQVKSGRRRALAYEDIPPVLVQAIISIEDHRFFQHPGLDVLGLARAILRNAGDDSVGQGGSTITQQLVKNTYLSPERTFRRKYAEAMLAFALERRLSKKDIFALYCNEIYLGEMGAVAVRGLEDAARMYFGKQLPELSLAEAATIAGMIQGPARYSPISHAGAAQERRKVVLDAMVREHWIDSREAASAANQSLVVVRAEDRDPVAPYYVDYVNRIADSQLQTSGRDQRIYTTIDPDLQNIAERAIQRQLDKLDGSRQNTEPKLQAALIALDPHNGEILAMVGGRNYAVSQLNRATDAHRQPGSTFKPFVYAAAVEDGISPAQLFADAPRDFIYDRNKVYRPANFGSGYSMRDVPMRTGLVKSLNTVTVAVALQTGLARIANLAARFGLPKPERYPALALGTSEVTPLELAAAYAAFDNGGRRVLPKVISSISEPQSSPTIASYGDGAQIISPTTAYIITNMLSAAVDHGTAQAARGALKGTAVAGKTGTSRDSWFAGYTPNLVCVVWIGFDDNEQLGLTGAEAALPAWTDFMRAAISRRPELGGRSFECPEGIKFVEIDSDNGLISTVSCPRRELIAVTDRLAPNLECYHHGNILAPIEESAPVTFRTAVASRRSIQPPLGSIAPLISIVLGQFGATRVDVDINGKRTLVNDLR